jgi:hypothetical protein
MASPSIRQERAGSVATAGDDAINPLPCTESELGPMPAALPLIPVSSFQMDPRVREAPLDVRGLLGGGQRLLAPPEFGKTVAETMQA